MPRIEHTPRALRARKQTHRDPKVAPLPDFEPPELATLTDAVPAGAGWVHEMKYDGYRMLARVDGKNVKMLTRSGKDWTNRMPTIARAVQGLPVRSALLDGEVCVLSEDGTTDFQRLQNSLNAGLDAVCVYFVFDLLHHDGKNLTSLPLLERKEALRALLEEAPDDRLRFSDHITGHGESFYRRACELGLEGIVSKRADRPYVGKRTSDWLKIKCARRQEFVIGGFTEPAGSRSHIGALLVGAYEGDDLVYRGKVGSGYTRQSLEELHDLLEQRELRTAPFIDPPKGSAAHGVHWVRPDLLAEIEYSEVTDDGVLRHPRFKGLRRDKPAEGVGLENAKAERPHRGAAGFALTNPGRVLYEGQGITKQDLAAYYIAVADHMLPHVAGRILTLVRCPEGQHKECFFQKHARRGTPAPIRTITIEERTKQGEYMVIDDLAGLMALVQLGAREVHTWGAHADRPEQPDQLVFDLDPDPDLGWHALADAAHRLRELLSGMGLVSFAKTTGGKGLHVVVPIERRSGWDIAKEFCRAVAHSMEESDPKRFVSTASKARRRGRIFVDYLRNARGATSVCAYSTRAKPGAPVSVPIAWDEVDRSLDPAAFDTRTVPRRLAARTRDPWEGFFEVRQSITRAMQLGIQQRRSGS